MIQLCSLFSSIAQDLVPDSTRYFSRMTTMVLPLIRHSLHTVQQAALDFLEVSTTGCVASGCCPQSCCWQMCQPGICWFLMCRTYVLVRMVLAHVLAWTCDVACPQSAIMQTDDEFMEPPMLAQVVNQMLDMLQPGVVKVGTVPLWSSKRALSLRNWPLDRSICVVPWLHQNEDIRIEIVSRLNILLKQLGSVNFNPYAADALQKLAKLLYSRKEAKSELGGVIMSVRAVCMHRVLVREWRLFYSGGVVLVPQVIAYISDHVGKANLDMDIGYNGLTLKVNSVCSPVSCGTPIHSPFAPPPRRPFPVGAVVETLCTPD